MKLVHAAALTSALCVGICSFAQTPTPFPNPDAVLHGPTQKGSAHVEVNLDKGTIAAYGNPDSMIQTTNISLSADGSLLTVGATPGTVDLWDLQKRKLLRTFDGTTAADISRDGKLIATSEIAVYEIASKKPICRSPWHPGDANAVIDRVRFSPDSRFLAITANGQTQRILETQTCRDVARLAETKDGDFTPDGKQFFAANYQKFTLWQVEGWKLLATFPAGPDYTKGLTISPDGRRALIAGPNNAKLVDIADGKTVGSFGKGWVSGVAFLTDEVFMVRDHQELTFRMADGSVLCADSSLKSGEMSLAQNGTFAIGAVHLRDVFLYSAESVKRACSGAN